MALMRKWAGALAVLLVAAAAPVAADLADPAAAEAAPPCRWEVRGDRSNCDGLTFQYTEEVLGCTDWRVVDDVVLGGRVHVELFYSRTCRAVAAGMWPAQEPPPGSSCYVKVERNSDGQAYRASMNTRTQVLYDADVTSYAWGHCEWGSGGPVYRGGTGSY